MEPASRRGMPVWLIVLATLGAIIGFGWSEQDYVTAAALLVMALAGLWGFYVGAMRLIGLFGGLTAAYALAQPVGERLAPYLQAESHFTPSTIRLISTTGGGALVLLSVTISTALITRFFLKSRPNLQAANHLLGFGVGSLQGAAAMLLLLNGILVVEPYAQHRIRMDRFSDGNPLAHTVAVRVVDLAKRTRSSTIASLLHAYNPFEKLPQLKNLPRAVAVVTGPEATFPARPAPTRMAQTPKSEVRQAIESLAQDPQLRRIATSQQPLSQQTAITLLNHPGIAKLLEHPDLMNQLYQAMGDLGVDSAQVIRTSGPIMADRGAAIP